MGEYLVLLLDNSALALVVNEGSAGGLLASLATEEADIGAWRCALVLARGRAAEGSAHNQEESGEEETGPGAPSEAKSVAADVGANTVMGKGVAFLDEDSAGQS